MKIDWHNKQNQESGQTTLEELRIILHGSTQATDEWFWVLEKVGYNTLNKTIYEGAE